MDVTWLACDLKSGLIRGELPLPRGPVRRMLAREETRTWTLPVDDPSCPDDWLEMTVPGFSMLVLCLDDVPVLGWAVTNRVLGTDGVTLSGATLEHCFARRNVATLLDERDEAWVCSFVVWPALEGFGFTSDVTSTGVIGYADYSSDEDLDCLRALNERMRTQDAPEWRITLARTGATIVKTFEIGPRIGQTRPEAVFELDDQGHGNIATYRRSTSYGPDGGATVVRAVGDGSGAARPMTGEYRSTLLDAGWPEWEARPSMVGVDFEAPSVDDEDAELRRLAYMTLVQREHGTETWEITGDDTAPRPGRDFAEGDTVPVLVEPQGKRDPVGGMTVVRVLGWELDPDSERVTLIGWEEQS